MAKQQSRASVADSKKAKQADVERDFDQSQLRANVHGKFVHRDYAAHYFRWGFAANFINNKTTVLDVGCGQDFPLAKVLSYLPSYNPKSYVGVDLNPLKPPTRQWLQAFGEFNFIKQHKPLPKFDVIVCFEVIEHMTKPLGLKLLKAFAEHLTLDGTLILSTPVFNRQKAVNHIHEYTIPELAKQVEKAGLTVQERFGTFTSWPELKKVLPAEQHELYQRLNRYYSHDVLSCFLAPLYPDHARNNTWIIKKGKKL